MATDTKQSEDRVENEAVNNPDGEVESESVQKPKRPRKSMRYKGMLISAYGATEAEAIRNLAEKVTAIESGLDEPSSYMTVNNWYWKWKELFKAHKGITQATLSSYDGLFRNYISPAIGDKQLYQVRHHQLQTILNGESDKSTSHLTKLRMIIVQLFKRAYTAQYIFRDPSVGLDLPAGTYKGHRIITKAERKAIYALAPHHPAGLWVLMLLNTGMRPGESVALTWADVRFDLDEISIIHAKESGSNKIKAPKTEAGIRVIPMRPLLKELLMAAAGKPDEPVFPNSKGGFMCSSTMYRMWASFKQALDIEMGATVDKDGNIVKSIVGDLKPYCFRHTFCSDLEKGGVALNLAKNLMGHNNISTTGDIYTHTDRESLHKSIDLFDKVAGGFAPATAPDATQSATASGDESSGKN